jgi:hypothetical protein
VIGVIVAAAIIDFSDSLRSRLLTVSKRAACDASAACRRHAAPGEDVLLDDVGELVGRVLALDRQAVQAPAELAHHVGDRGQDDGDELVSCQLSQIR